MCIFGQPRPENVLILGYDSHDQQRHNCIDLAPRFLESAASAVPGDIQLGEGNISALVEKGSA
jgi:hypothetical protein